MIIKSYVNLDEIKPTLDDLTKSLSDKVKVDQASFDQLKKEVKVYNTPIERLPLYLSYQN